MSPGVSSPLRNARPQSRSPPREQPNPDINSPSKSMNALNMAYNKAMGKKEHVSPTWKWIAGKLNETQSPQNAVVFDTFQPSPSPAQQRPSLMERITVKE